MRIGEDMFGAMDIAISGLKANRKQMDVIASNVVNSRTTDAGNGKPYRRLEALLEDISNRSAQEIADQLVYATSAHAGSEAELTDDRAVVVIKVVAPCA